MFLKVNRFMLFRTSFEHLSHPRRRNHKVYTLLQYGEGTYLIANVTLEKRGLWALRVLLVEATTTTAATHLLNP